MLYGFLSEFDNKLYHIRKTILNKTYEKTYV